MADDTITIRLNKDEREQLEKIKTFLCLTNQFGADSKTIKGCLNYVENATHRVWGGNMGAMFYRKKPSGEVLDIKRDEEEGHFNG